MLRISFGLGRIWRDRGEQVRCGARAEHKMLGSALFYLPLAFRRDLSV